MTTHDFTKRRWGHNVEILRIENDGHRLHVAGWCHGVNVGDYLLLANGDAATRYQIAELRRPGDPPDMWFAELDFAPREEAAS